MICFGAKKDQEMKENGTCGSHFKLKKNKNKQTIQKADRDGECKRERI